MHNIRMHLTYANVMATIAVFIALGGTGYAALKLPKNSVGTAQLRRNAVIDTKIRADAVGRSELRRNAVGTSEIRDATIVAADIHDAAIKTQHLDSTLVAPKATQATRAENADNAGKVGGLTADQLKDRCPAGAQLDAGGCIETTARAATAWPIAARTCAASPGIRGGRLPTLAELEALPSQPGGSTEWTSDVVGATNPPQVALKNVANGDTLFDTTNHEHAFRCVLSPTNQ